MSSEMAVKCPICGSPYRAYSHYAGDQSVCPDCRARARGRTVATPSTSPEVTYGYYACDKCLSQREFIRGANAEKIAQLESRIAELETELAKFKPCSLNEQGEPDAPPLHPAQTERGCMSFEHDGSQNSAWYCEIHGASVWHKEGE